MYMFRDPFKAEEKDLTKLTLAKAKAKALKKSKISLDEDSLFD
jgi:hypothetical protein